MIVSIPQNTTGQCFHLRNPLNQFVGATLFPLSLLLIYQNLCFQARQITNETVLVPSWGLDKSPFVTTDAADLLSDFYGVPSFSRLESPPGYFRATVGKFSFPRCAAAPGFLLSSQTLTHALWCQGPGLTPGFPVVSAAFHCCDWVSFPVKAKGSIKVLGLDGLYSEN